MMEREHRNIEDSVSQGASQLKSQILVYNNLSDYIAFNQPISDVLIGDYDNIFSMYEQYTATVDPVLSSLKYFNPNINQITIYLDKNIVKHDTMVDSLQTIEGEKWYRQNESSLSQKVKWIIDAENKTSFSARTMPIMEQNKQKGILYLDVNYDSLFAGFDDISRDSYGLYIVDKKGNVLFEKDTFSENTASKNNTKTTAKKSKEKRLSFPALKKKMEAQENGKKSNYLIVSADAGVDDWKIIVYQPQKMMAREIQTLLVSRVLSGIFLAFPVIILILSPFCRAAAKVIRPFGQSVFFLGFPCRLIRKMCGDPFGIALRNSLHRGKLADIRRLYRGERSEMRKKRLRFLFSDSVYILKSRTLQRLSLGVRHLRHRKAVNLFLKAVYESEYLIVARDIDLAARSDHRSRLVVRILDHAEHWHVDPETLKLFGDNAHMTRSAVKQNKVGVFRKRSVLIRQMRHTPTERFSHRLVIVGSRKVFYAEIPIILL